MATGGPRNGLIVARLPYPFPDLKAKGSKERAVSGQRAEFARPF